MTFALSEIIILTTNFKTMEKNFVNSIKVVNTTNVSTNSLLAELQSSCFGIVVNENIIHTTRYNLAQIANALVGIATILNTKKMRMFSAEILSTETILLK